MAAVVLLATAALLLHAAADAAIDGGAAAAAAGGAEEAGASSAAACGSSDGCRVGIAAEPSEPVGLLQMAAAGGRRKAAASRGVVHSSMLATDASPQPKSCFKTVPAAVPEVEQCMQDHFSVFRQGIIDLGAHGFSLNPTKLKSLFCEFFDPGLPPAPMLAGSAKKQLGSTPCRRPICPWWSCRCWRREMMRPGVETDVFPDHKRRDDDAPGCVGQGQLVSDWMRPTRLRRYLPQLGEEMPPQVGVRTTEEYIDIVNSVLSADGGEFHATCPKQLAAIRKKIARVNWRNVIIHLWAAPPDRDGVAYSPAFNSIFIVWCKTSRRLSHYMIVAADAFGTARTKYIGIDFGAVYRSITGTLYTPLTFSEQNPLHFRLPYFNPMNLHKPWRFDIWVWRERLPPPKYSWYIQVSTALQCVEGGGQIPSADQVVAKEYYMSRIMEAYFGGAPPQPSGASATIATLVDNLVPWEHIESCKKVATKYRKLLRPLPEPTTDESLPWFQKPGCTAPTL